MDQELLESHAGLVTRIAGEIASRLPSRSVSREDLIGWGLDGLADAGRRFDPAKAASATYAWHRSEATSLRLSAFGGFAGVL